MTQFSGGEETAATRVEGSLPGGRFWQGWTVDTPVGAVVLVHGLHEHGGRYAHVAERLAPAGYAGYVVDHPGHRPSAGGPRENRRNGGPPRGGAPLVPPVGGAAP